MDFSFSGLKTAVLRLVRERTGAPVSGKAAAADAAGATLPRGDVADICASFQKVVVETLIDRTFEAAGWLGARSVGIAGGVSANSRLRADAQARGLRLGLPVFVPPLSLSTDNAAMIGAAGLRILRTEPPGIDLTFNAEASLPLIMKAFTDYLWFNTKTRQEFLRITDEVAAIVKKSGVQEGMVLVSAMHITAGVYVNDWEDGLIHDFQEWLEKLAPAGLPYRHHQTGEDNADAHLKRTLMGHQVIVPITGGATRSRAVGTGLLRGVRRAAAQAGRRQGDGDMIRSLRRGV